MTKISAISPAGHCFCLKERPSQGGGHAPHTARWATRSRFGVSCRGVTTGSTPPSEVGERWLELLATRQWSIQQGRIPRGRGRAWTYGRETDTPAAGARPGPTVEKRTPVRAGENPGASSPEDGWEVHGGPKPEERRMGSPTLLGAGEQQSRHARKFESVLSAGRAWGRHRVRSWA